MKNNKLSVHISKETKFYIQQKQINIDIWSIVSKLNKYQNRLKNECMHILHIPISFQKPCTGSFKAIGKSLSQENLIHAAKTKGENESLNFFFNRQ